MRPSKLIRLAVPLALLAACGGSTDTTSSARANAAPSYAALSLDQVTTDSTAAALTATGADAVTAMPAPTVTDPTCHPHLFIRQREVVERLNRHIYKALRHVERAIAAGQVNDTTTTRTWTLVENGLERSFTLTETAPSIYTWELDVGPAGTTPLPVVLTGQIDRTGATGPHQGKGTLHVDFAALHAGFPAEKVAQGTLDVTFDTEAATRTLTVTAKDVAWDLDAARFENSPALLAALSAPRSGAYVYHRERGVGGSLKIQDQMVFACPANPGLVAADAQLVSRWYRAADGAFHGRSDALMTGGQLTAPVDHVYGVTCHLGPAEGASQAEGLWLMKAEKADGSTVKAWSDQSGDAPCDPAYGPMPTVTDAANDFTGWPASYSDGVPFPFKP